MFEHLENNIGLLLLVYTIYYIGYDIIEFLKERIRDKRAQEVNKYKASELNTNVSQLLLKQQVSHMLEGSGIKAYFNTKIYHSNTVEEYNGVAYKTLKKLEDNIEELYHVLMVSNKTEKSIAYAVFINNKSIVNYYAISAPDYLRFPNNRDKLKLGLTEKEYKDIEVIIQKYNINIDLTDGEF